jgi:hypothetical protein
MTSVEFSGERGKGNGGRTVAALGTLLVVTKHLVDGLSEELVHVDWGISEVIWMCQSLSR